MQIRVDFTVKGATVDALNVEAQRELERLGGEAYAGAILSMRIQDDYRTEPNGQVVSWRAEVEASLHLKSEDEEPF